MRSVLTFFGLAGIVLGWNAPNHYPPWPTFHLELIASVGIAALALGLLSTRRGHARGVAPTSGQTLPPPAAVWAWLVVAALPLLQFGLGQLHFRGDAILGWMYAAGAALSVYLGRLWCTRDGEAAVLRRLWLTVLLGGLAANGLALHQWLGLGTPGWWAMDLIDGRPYGNFGQPNNFGLLMVWSILAALALYEQATIQARATLALTIVFLGFGVFASQSRAALLALTVPVFAWVHLHRRRQTRLTLLELLAGLFALACLYWLEQHLRGIGSAQPASAVRELTDIGARRPIWLHFWAAIQSQPWIGHGFNQSVAALAEVAPHVEPSRNTIYAHSVVLDLMTWFGIPVALAMMAALLAWVMGWLRHRDKADPHAPQRVYVGAIWLALLLQSLLEFPYAHAYFLLPACLLAGCVGTPANSEHLPAIQASRLMQCLAFLTGGLLCLAATEYMTLEDDFRFNRFARANFTNRPAHQPTGSVWVLDQLAALNRGAELKPRAGMSKEELEQLHILARRFHILSVRFDYAKALALNGQLAQAEQELVVIKAAHAPVVFPGIRRSWDQWLAEHQQEIQAGAR